LDYPSLRQLLNGLILYRRQGDEYLRRSERSSLGKALISANRRGLDLHQYIESLLPEIEAIERLSRQLNQAWQSVLLRSCVVVVSAMILRHFCNVMSQSELQGDLLIFDRIVLVTAILCFLILSMWLFYRYLKSGWNCTRQRWLWFHFVAYLGHVEDLGVAHAPSRILRQIMRDGLRTGIEPTLARMSWVKQQIFMMQEILEKEVRSMSVLSVGVELLVYAMAFGGFLAAPLLMWLEYASGLG
jgi:hypothetical protein